MAKSRQYQVYGVGNALVDIQAAVSDSILARLEFAKGTMTLVHEPTQIQVLQSLDGAPVTRCAGGSAANTIMGIADFGGRAAYVGKVADDEIGDFFLSDMRRLGIAVEVPPAHRGQSGTCAILITDDAERTMLTHVGVSATLAPADVVESEIAKAEYVYIEGYLFAAENTKAAAIRAIELAKKNGVQVALTVSDPFLITLCKDQFLELIAGPVDLLFCNLDEARSLTGQEDPIEAARAIHHHTANVALTMGDKGSILMVEGEVLPVEPVPVEALDTTGAGDMYAAGLLHGITAGMTWQQAGHLASHAAARIVAQRGARLVCPFTPQEIEELVSR